MQTDEHDVTGPTRLRRPRGVVDRIAGTLLWLAVALPAVLLAAAHVMPGGFGGGDSHLSRLTAAVALYARVFQCHLAALCLLAAALALPLRRWRLTGIAVLVGGLALLPCLPSWLPKPDSKPDSMPDAPGTPVRLVSMNLQGENRDAGRILAAVRAADPDVLCIQEFTPYHDAALTPALAAAYPYRLLFPHAGYDGMAVFSRFPLRLEAAPAAGAPDRWPDRVLRAALSVGGREVALYNVHLMAIDTADRVARNRAETAALARAVASEARPAIVAGDFNFTDTTAGAAALGRAGLTDTARLAGAGPRPTWPGSGWPWRCGVRIDHVYVSRPFACTDDDVGGDVGSDHRPVAVRLVLPPP